MEINTKEIAYVLGFIWADGYLAKKSSIRTECLEDDINQIEKAFDSLGVVKKYTRNRPNRKTVSRLEINSVVLCRFLAENDYELKSYTSPDKILSKTPKELQPFFFRGVIDGDGCFYYNKKQYLSQFSLCSTYEQDWSYIEKLFNEIKIENYKIVRREHPKSSSKSSIVRITNKKDLTKLGKFIYGSNFPLAPLDSCSGGISSGLDIGLPRKFLKLSMICSIDTGV